MIEHINAYMSVLDQRVRAREQKQARVPEAHQVAHKRLLVGEDEPGDDDLQLGDDDQHGEPGEAKGARQGGQRQRHRNERQVEIDAAELTAAEILRELLTNEGHQQLLDPQKGDHRIGQTNQQYGPESEACNVGGDCRDGEVVLAQPACRTGNHEQHRAGNSRPVQRNLQPGCTARLRAQRRSRPRPTDPDRQIDIDQKREQHRYQRPGDHPRQRADQPGRVVTLRRGRGDRCHESSSPGIMGRGGRPVPCATSSEYDLPAAPDLLRCPGRGSA